MRAYPTTDLACTARILSLYKHTREATGPAKTRATRCCKEEHRTGNPTKPTNKED